MSVLYVLFKELRKSPEFLQIPVTHLIDLVRSPDLCVNTEQEVFETVIRWVSENVEERKLHLPDLLARVRLAQLPTAYLIHTVKKHPLIVVSN
jgi:hypothetical protein